MTTQKLSGNRIIRYLKRWKDFQFSEKGNARPPGIALTMTAYQLFQPSVKIDVFANARDYDKSRSWWGLAGAVDR